jgi:hypothetical protein
MESQRIEDKVQMILRQTNYTEQEALAKLNECSNEPLLVIKQFLGIPEKNTPQISSVNQEIYKQLRHKLDSSMREYKTKTETNTK